MKLLTGSKLIAASIAVALLLSVHTSLHAQSRLFYETNLIVVRVGNGTQTLSTAGNSFFIDQFTTNGSFVSTLAVPDIGPSALVLSGATFADAFLTRSYDGRLLTVAAYSRSVGTTGDITTTSSVPRAVLNIDAFGNLQQPPVTTTDFNGYVWRCAVTDGTNFHWGVGSGAGVVYLGNATAKAIVENNKANCRVIQIFNNNLYMSSLANNYDGFTGIYKFFGSPNFANSLPAPTIFTNTYNSTSLRGINDFAVNAANTIIYCADSRDYTSVEGGIQRWDFDNVHNVWVNSYHLTNGLPGDGLQNITVDWSGAVPVIYATTIGTIATNPTSMVRVVDTGATSPFVTLATSGANQAYRGIKFGPRVGAPFIFSPPINQFSVLGSNATFTVGASSETPMSYQWLFNGAPIADALDSALNLPNVQLTNAGTYQVVVTNSSGTSTSLPATLTIVTNGPVITSISGNPLFPVGGTATLTANTTSQGPIIYQWRFNGSAIDGATASKLTIPNVQFTNAGSYSVYATNLYSFTSNTTGQVTVFTPPQNLSVAAGSDAVFSTQVVGPVSPSATWQWRFKGQSIAQATNSTFTVTSSQPTNGGAYTLVTSVPGYSISLYATLSVQTPVTNNPPGSIAAPSGLINWWPFEGGFNDVFGANDAFARANTAIVPAEVGYGCAFDGASGSYLSVGASPVPPPWSASFWVNRINAKPFLGGGSISACLIGDSSTSLRLEQYNGTRKVGITAFGNYDFAFNYIAPTNIWTHLVFVSTATNTALYANGTLQGTTTNVINLPRGQIGGDAGGALDPLNGTLDEIMLFNRALDPEEILALYNAGSAGVLRAPEFLPSSASADQFTTSIRGLTGKTISVYSSSNLIDWNFLTTATNTNGLLPFTDPTPDSPGLRFYKATQQ